MYPVNLGMSCGWIVDKSALYYYPQSILKLSTGLSPVYPASATGHKDSDQFSVWTNFLIVKHPIPEYFSCSFFPT